FTAPLKLLRPLKMGIGISSPSWDYEMEHYLGSGAYGAVVQSKKLGTNETVALKVIKNERYMEIRICCLFAPVIG
uniref:Protein kinase domain-containing protein n=1 Tax=Poecilia reticulata TaxID=8081 RepID=A0A3P9MTW9_POERE